MAKKEAQAGAIESMSIVEETDYVDIEDILDETLESLSE